MPNPSTGTPALLVTQPFLDFYGLGVNVVDSLRAGSKWGTTTLTYSFPATIGSTWAASYGDGEPSSQKFRGLTLTEQDAAKAVIAQWATVANLRLTQTVDTAQEVGTFRFAFTDTDMGPTTTAYSYLPTSNVVGGDTWLNPDHPSLQGSWAAGSSAFQTLLHEFGHSLGLKHPFVSSATGGPAAPIEYQTRSATVMAYESEPTLGQGGQTGFTFEPTTPMRLDILAIQQLYGANSAWNSTSTTYAFGGADLYHQTIWDAGGSDDRIVYNAVTDGDIDLRPGHSSRLGAPVYTRWNGSQSTINQVDNIWIAYGVDIENADGGGGNDRIHGNSLANELNGGAGDDTLLGDAGDDRFDWAADLRGGNDTMVGGPGDDVYVIFGNDTVVELANEGTDTIWCPSDFSLESIAHVENLSHFGSGSATLRGNSLGNQLFGNAANDLLFGFDGNDVLIGGSGNNTLDGGFGTDTAQYASTAGELNVNLATGTASRNGAGGADVLIGIENVTGNDLGNILTGNGLDNVLTGGAGADTLAGGAGNDTLRGNEGADLFDWAADQRGGNDTMFGGAGDDVYVILGNDTVVELASQGTDTIFVESDFSLESIAHVENLTYFGSGGATLRGNGLGNQLLGNAGGDQLYGLDGNDVLAGGSGNNRLDGGSGKDTARYASTAGEVIVNLEAGSASRNGTGGADVLIGIEDVIGNDRGNILIGSGLDNVLTGGSGADTLSGGAGNDTLVSLGGADTLLGGSGNDTFEVLDRAASIVEAIGEGSDTVRTPFDVFVLPGNVENLVYLGSAAFLGIGNELGNTLTGGTQRDELHGYGGDDVLNPGSGLANTALGGDGNDSYNIGAVGDSIVESSTGGYDTVNTALTTMTLAPNVEKLVFTGQGNFVGSGNAADNLLVGGTGLDVLIGHGGNDTLVSNGGSDELIGGLGDDVYQVLSRAVSIIEFVGQGSDRIETPASIYVLNAQVENLSFTGSGSFLGIGNELANVLRGGTGADDLYGREGNDWFYGSTGAANTLLGGSGDDAYVVEAVGESIVEALGEGSDLVVAYTSSFRLPANVEFLWYQGSGAFLGLGNELDNYLTGRGGADVLQGLAGNDLLTGGSGADELSGGSGADQFQYVGGEIGIDTIVDFKPGEDKILVSSGFYPVTPQFSLVQGSAPLLTSANSTFIYNSSTGIVSFDADGTGVTAAVSLASIGAGKILQIADFGYSSGTIRPLQATEPGSDDGAHARARAASAEFPRAGSGNDWLVVEEGDLVQAASVSHQGDAGWLL